jgi:hypothetical protein
MEDGETGASIQSVQSLADGVRDQPTPSYGGNDCQGSPTETSDCRQTNCPEGLLQLNYHYNADSVLFFTFFYLLSV